MNNSKKSCEECAKNKYKQCPAGSDEMWERGFMNREGIDDCFVEKYCGDCESFSPFYEIYTTARGVCCVSGKVVWAYSECSQKKIKHHSH